MMWPSLAPLVTFLGMVWYPFQILAPPDNNGEIGSMSQFGGEGVR